MVVFMNSYRKMEVVAPERAEWRHVVQRSMPATRNKCWQAASVVGHAANDGGATTLAIHCWPPSIHRARPHGLELLATRPPRTAGLGVL